MDIKELFRENVNGRQKTAIVSIYTISHTIVCFSFMKCALRLRVSHLPTMPQYSPVAVHQS